MVKLATMSSVCPEWTLDQVIAAMKRHGYQGLEPRVEWGHACGMELDLAPAARRQARQRFADEGMEICCLATGVRMAEPDPGERNRHLEALRRYLDLAGDLGCPLVRTFGGQRARDREWRAVAEYVAEGYAQVLDQAQSRGVAVLLETHDDWCCAAPVRTVVELVGHPCLGVLWDVMHPQRMLEKPEETFQAIGRHTRHVHIHDGRYEDGRMDIGPLGSGVIDHLGPLRLLAGSGFAGHYSVEVIHQAGKPHDADGVLRQYARKFGELAAGI